MTLSVSLSFGLIGVSQNSIFVYSVNNRLIIYIISFVIKLQIWFLLMKKTKNNDDDNVEKKRSDF